MKNQKFLIVSTEEEVNNWLDRGWEVISVTAQVVSTAKGGGWDDAYASGKFAVVIQKQDSINPQL